MTKTQQSFFVLIFEHFNFDIVSNFGFRASSFLVVSEMNVFRKNVTGTI